MVVPLLRPFSILKQSQRAHRLPPHETSPVYPSLCKAAIPEPLSSAFAISKVNTYVNNHTVPNEGHDTKMYTKTLRACPHVGSVSKCVISKRPLSQSLRFLLFCNLFGPRPTVCHSSYISILPNPQMRQSRHTEPASVLVCSVGRDLFAQLCIARPQRPNSRYLQIHHRMVAFDTVYAAPFILQYIIITPRLISTSLIRSSHRVRKNARLRSKRKNRVT